MACTGCPQFAVGDVVETGFLGDPSGPPCPVPCPPAGYVVTGLSPFTVRQISQLGWRDCGYQATLDLSAYPGCVCDTVFGAEVTAPPDCPYSGGTYIPGASSTSFNPAWLLVSAGATLGLIALSSHRNARERRQRR